MIFSGFCLADPPKGEKNIPEYYPGQSYKIDFLQPDHYPKKFDGVGQLDKLNEENVIINYTGVPLAVGVRFYVPERKNSVSSKRFLPGERVGYIVDKDGNIESLWLLVRASYDG